VFDVACRVNESVETLGSSYRADGYTLENPNTAVGRFGAMRHALVLDSTLGPVAQSLSMSADQLRVDCLMARSTMPHTARWKYAVALT
jgi:hypothetical protein